MEKKDIEELRTRVGCAAVLEHEGFAIDRKESTRRAVKFRLDDDTSIVIHDDRGWFDARSDARAMFLRSQAISMGSDLQKPWWLSATWSRFSQLHRFGRILSIERKRWLRSLTAGTTKTAVACIGNVELSSTKPGAAMAGHLCGDRGGRSSGRPIWLDVGKTCR